MQEKYS